MIDSRQWEQLRNRGARDLPVAAFVGAGISVPAPSRLPAFEQVRLALAAGFRVSVGRPMSEAVTAIAPEALLQTLQDAGAPIDEIVPALLRSDSPNAIHFAMADLIEVGGSVFTVNADELIEGALSYLAPVRGQRPEVEAWAGTHKLHGTISRPATLQFQTQDVTKTASRILVGRMTNAWRRRIVLISGYAGGDPDIAPALKEAIRTAELVGWFDFRDRLSGVLSQFRSTDAYGHVHFIGDELPAAAFLNALKRECSAIQERPDLERQLHISEVVHLPDLSQFNLHRYHAAAARFIERTGGGRYRMRFVAGLFSGAVQQRRSSARGLLVEGLFGDNAWGSAFRGALSLAGEASILASRNRRRPLARPGARILDAYSRTLEQRGDFAKAASAASAGLVSDQASLKLLLDYAAAARRTVALRQAFSAASTALELIGRRGAAGELVGRAYFEAAYCARLLDKLDTAHEILTEFETRFASQGGARWNAWAKHERAALQLLRGGDTETSDRMLREVADFFWRVGDTPQVVHTLLARVSILRAMGEWREAQRLLRDARVEMSAHPRYTSKTEDLVAFAEAELARAFSQYSEAERTYLRLRTRSSFHHIRALSACGLALTDHHHATGAAEDGLRLATMMNFGFGVRLATYLLRPRPGPTRVLWLREQQICFP